jgi:hypothetical protein
LSKLRIGSKTSTKIISRKKIKKEARKKTISFEDVNLLLKIAELPNTHYDFQLSEWFWSKLHKEEIPKSINEFESKFSQGNK